MRRSGVSLLAGLLLLFSGILPASAEGPAEPFFGVAGHFLHTDAFYRNGDNFWHVDQTLPLVKELSVGLVHEAVYALNDPKGALVVGGKPELAARVAQNRMIVDSYLKRYDASGLAVTLTVFGNSPVVPHSAASNEQFSDWVAELLSRHPSVKYVQLHNEPNLKFFWKGTPEDYVKVYREYARKIKAKRPDIHFLGGAISSLWFEPGVKWLEAAVKAGLLEFADSISVHPYSAGKPPEVDPHYTGKGSVSDAIVAFDQMLRRWNGGKPVPLHFTEFGYSTGKDKQGWVVVNDAVKADYVARAVLQFVTARVAGVPLQNIVYYDLKDDGTGDGSQAKYGLVSYDLRERKPAFHVYRSLARLLADPGSLKASPVAVSGAEGLQHRIWRRPDGSTLLFVWSTGEAQRRTLRFSQSPGRLVQRFSMARPTGEAVTGGTRLQELDVEATSAPSWFVFSP